MMVGSDPLTSAGAAQLLGVGPSSVKRWADAGLLPSERTPGGHRRFRRAEVLALVRRLRGAPKAIEATPSGDLADDPLAAELLAARSAERVQAILLRTRADLGSWCSAAERLGAALRAVGHGWAQGLVSIVDEHIMTACLERATGAVSDAIPTSPSAPVALLAVAEGDPHSLGLRLAEPCLRELGWRTLWVGANTPNEELERQARDEQVRVIVLTASGSHPDAADLQRQARSLRDACAREGVRLILGGYGLWPEDMSDVIRLRHFTQLPVGLGPAPASPLQRTAP
jgi:excisionase family DNA binding protein